MIAAVVVIPLSLAAGPAVQAAFAADGSTVVLTPASGAPGATVQASGTDWTAGDHIQAEWGDNDSNLGSPVVVASGGTFTDSFAIPSAATTGSHQVLFWDQESRYFEVANFDVTSSTSPNPPPPPPPSCNPSVSLTPNSGAVGSKFVLAGSGWAAGTVKITLPYGSKGLFYASTWSPTVSTGGTWQFAATVGNSPAGSYTFTFAESGCSSRTGTFTVKAAATCPPAPHPTIYWSQVAGPQGTQFSLTGSNWYPNETVAIHLPSGNIFDVNSTSWRADSKGDWNQKITVDDAARLGTYGLTFSQSGCGGLRVAGDFKVTLTISQYINAVKAVYQLVSAANSVCNILSCSKPWSSSLASKAIGTIDTALIVFYEAKAIPESVIVGNDLKALEAALKKAHNNKKDPSVQKAAKQLKSDTEALENTLLAICPPLEFLFPPAVS
jgi:hypothetical protein